MPRLTCVLLLWTLSVAAAAAPVTARFAGRDLRIADQGHKLIVRRAVPPYATRMVVHSIGKRDGVYYVLTGGTEPSRPGAKPHSVCGMSEDDYIEWLAVSNGAIRDRKKTRYRSCDATGSPGNWHNGRFLWSSERLDGTLFQYSFDPAEPQKGIMEEARRPVDSTAKTPARD